MQNHNKSRKNGFTLAEVLITLGVIGVVAALTLPSVISNYKEREYIAKLKKSYSILNQAFNAAIADYGTVDNWCERPLDRARCALNMRDIIAKYLVLGHKCNDNLISHLKCIQRYYKSELGDNTLLTTAALYSLITNDGIGYLFLAVPGDGYDNNWCKTTVNDLTSGSFFYNCGYIYVDITGPSKPNVIGKDLFAFKIFQDGVRPGGIPADTVWTERFKDQCLGTNSVGVSKAWCTGWVIINDNMDYWHCKDLDWNTKTSCKKK